jgi:16S rRNA processing protein RimM
MPGKTPTAPTSTSTSSWLKIGRVGKAHGLRGDFFVSGRDGPIPNNYREVMIGKSEDSARPAKIEKSGWLSEKPVLKCSLAGDRNAAEELNGQAIWVDEQAIKIDDASEYLWSDLEGRQVSGSDGACLGRVRSVYNAGAGDVLEIEDSKGRVLGIPMVSQYVDMSFTRGGDELLLVVPIETFADLWQTPPKPAEDAQKRRTKTQKPPAPKP